MKKIESKNLQNKKIGLCPMSKGRIAHIRKKCQCKNLPAKKVHLGLMSKRGTVQSYQNKHSTN